MRSKSRALEISQFWQNLQVRLQPGSAEGQDRRTRQEVVERLLSIGSMQKFDERP